MGLEFLNGGEQNAQQWSRTKGSSGLATNPQTHDNEEQQTLGLAEWKVPKGLDGSLGYSFPLRHLRNRGSASCPRRIRGAVLYWKGKKKKSSAILAFICLKAAHAYHLTAHVREQIKASRNESAIRQN